MKAPVRWLTPSWLGGKPNCLLAWWGQFGEASREGLVCSVVVHPARFGNCLERKKILLLALIPGWWVGQLLPPSLEGKGNWCSKRKLSGAKCYIVHGRTGPWALIFLAWYTNSFLLGQLWSECGRGLWLWLSLRVSWVWWRPGSPF